MINLENWIGKKVLVRTYSAGVHFGILAEKDGQEVILNDVYRLWSWQGALSLSEIAEDGLDLGNSIISVKNEKRWLLGVIEITPINPKSNIYDYAK